MAAMPKREQKTASIRLRIAPESKAHLEDLAQRAGFSLSEYIRYSVAMLSLVQVEAEAREGELSAKAPGDYLRRAMRDYAQRSDPARQLAERFRELLVGEATPTKLDDPIHRAAMVAVLEYQRTFEQQPPPGIPRPGLDPKQNASESEAGQGD